MKKFSKQATLLKILFFTSLLGSREVTTCGGLLGK